MTVQWLELPPEPAEALARVIEVSRTAPVLVFKKSPICPTSTRAENELHRWIEETPAQRSVTVALVDVLAERRLARGLTELLGIRHESPQALLLVDGALCWHASHEALTAAEFQAQIGAAVPAGDQ